MKFTIEIPDAADDQYVRLLQEEATRLRITVEEYLATLAIKEAQRLWHIERSRPRVPKPNGRPRHTSEDRALKLLAAEILPIYDKLKTLYGEKDFQRIYGHQYSQVVDMIEDKDLEGLRKWISVQPWTKRGQ